MNNYRITVQHDKGQCNITVTATDSATACNMVMQAENCPARAIVNVVQCSPVIKQEALPMSETVMYGTRKGSEDWQEEIITTNPAAFEAAKAWAIDQGFDRFRIATINLSTPPDFTKTIR